MHPVTYPSICRHKEEEKLMFIIYLPYNRQCAENVIEFVLFHLTFIKKHYIHLIDG